MPLTPVEISNKDRQGADLPRERGVTAFCPGSYVAQEMRYQAIFLIILFST